MIDAFIESAAKSMFESHLSRYGELERFQWDREQRRMRIILRPAGEPNATLEVRILRYRVEKEAGKVFLVAEDVMSSRPWVQALLVDFVKDTRLELPEGMEMVTAML